MAYMLLKDTGIYANNQVIRNGLNFAQGLAVGMLFSGIIMSSRYGAKVKAFKQRLFKKNDISMKYIKGRNDGRIS